MNWLITTWVGIIMLVLLLRWSKTQYFKRLYMEVRVNKLCGSLGIDPKGMTYPEVFDQLERIISQLRGMEIKP